MASRSIDESSLDAIVKAGDQSNITEFERLFGAYVQPALRPGTFFKIHSGVERCTRLFGCQSVFFLAILRLYYLPADVNIGPIINETTLPFILTVEIIPLLSRTQFFEAVRSTSYFPTLLSLLRSTETVRPLPIFFDSLPGNTSEQTPFGVLLGEIYASRGTDLIVHLMQLHSDYNDMDTVLHQVTNMTEMLSAERAAEVLVLLVTDEKFNNCHQKQPLSDCLHAIINQ
jgi:hypothetical protein